MTDNRTTERVDHSPRVREAINELMREKDATDSRTTELLPCPFCGSSIVHIRSIKWLEPEYHAFYVLCMECGASGATFDNKAEAIEAWNTRAERTCRNKAIDVNKVTLQAKIDQMNEAREMRKEAANG